MKIILIVSLLLNLYFALTLCRESTRITVKGVAGDIMIAGDTVYLSVGLHGDTAGRWYKTGHK